MYDVGRPSWSPWMGVLLAVAAVLICWLGYRLHVRSMQSALQRAWPVDLQRDRQMLQTAARIARPLYAEHCASCHAANLAGNRTIGAPPLTGVAWLYGDGGIGDLENTILYGVRSGHPKSHNVTDMPPAGRTHQLTVSQVSDVVEYVLSLNRQAHDESAAQRGQQIFLDRGNCFDCHGADARGNSDYGAPSLLGPNWLYGSDRQTLYQSVYDGRHGLCPAWSRKLSAAQIRALAAFLYLESHPHAG